MTTGLQVLPKPDMKTLSSIELHLDQIAPGLRLYIDARKPDTLFDGEEDAAEHNEARYQLMEGFFLRLCVQPSQLPAGRCGGKHHHPA